MLRHARFRQGWTRPKDPKSWRVNRNHWAASELLAFWWFDGLQAIDLAFGRETTQTSITPENGPVGPQAVWNGTSSKMVMAADTFYDAAAHTIVTGMTPSSLVQFDPLVMRWNEGSNLRGFSVVMNDNTGKVRMDHGNGVADLGNSVSSGSLFVANRRTVLGVTIENSATGDQYASDIGYDSGFSNANSILTGSNNPLSVGYAPVWGGAERFGHISCDCVVIWGRKLDNGQLLEMCRDPYQLLMPVRQRMRPFGVATTVATGNHQTAVTVVCT